MRELSTDTGSAFRPRARLLQLLGEQLIGSARLAVFELVKNAYDADASHVSITLAGLDSRSPSITVRDNGFGMSRRTIETVWLVPGHDHKQSQRTSGQLTPKGRLPLGEKGVGRFAVHKLGTRIELVTRRTGSPELAMTLDWDELASYEYLDEARVQIEERRPQVFPASEHGTQITITKLRDAWTRGEVRRLARQITSLSSPFGRRSDTMTTEFLVPDHEDWLDDLSDVTDLVDNAPWKFQFSISENYFEWEYEFRGVSGTGVTPRKVSGARIGVLLDPKTLPDPEGDRRRLAKKSSEPEIVSTVAMQKNIGPIRGTFFIYDRDRWVLDAMGAPLGLTDYLNDNGGIRVYRDGIRVYNYGEPSDDWLGLDIRRVNAPSKRISRNIVVGAIDLDLSASVGLSEKTNREGFVESEDFTYLRSIVLGVVAQMENERNIDKEILRKVLKPAKTGAQKSISTPLEKVRQIAKNHGILDQIAPLTEAAQNAYDEMREIMLRSGVSNMTLAVVFHEIDHGVRLLERAVEQGASPEGILRQARDLLGLLDGFGDLLKRGDIRTIDLRVVVERAMSLNRIRLRSHKIALETHLSAAALDSALAKVPVGLVMGAITNIIDNSVYWLRTKWIDSSQRAIYVGIDTESFPEGPAIIVGDTGPGFLDSFEEVTSPFFSRRPDGIGIGLYYVSMIMGLSGGSLRIVRPSDVQIPQKYDGAVLALVFKKV